MNVRMLLIFCAVVAPTLLAQQFSATPLIDYRPGQLYLGHYPGLLYENANTASGDHEAAGVAAALSIQPLDANGHPSPRGKIVAVTAGESNTTEESCDGVFPACFPLSFIGQWRDDRAANHLTLAIVDGAASGRVVLTWTCDKGICPWYTGADGTVLAHVENQYDRVLNTILIPNGLTEEQVQIAIFDEAATKLPILSLFDGGPKSDAYILEANLAKAIRAARHRWPNLKQVFVNSRIYAGYNAFKELNPEPFAYEGGFAVKWLIEAQVVQRRTGVVDPVAGDLLGNGLPWIGWAAYIWGNGNSNPAGSTALSWSPWVSRQDIGDYQTDNLHPNRNGIQLVGTALDNFFLSSQYSPWFRR